MSDVYEPGDESLSDEDETEDSAELDAFFEEGLAWAVQSEGAPAGVTDDEDEDEDEDEEVSDDAEDDDDEVARASTRPPPPPTLITPPGFHGVRQGECLRSIAARFRVKPDAIWNDPNNAALIADRKEGTLLEGDSLFIPERTRRVVRAATHRRHVFQLGASQCEIVLTLRRGGEPRASIAYTLEVDGETRQGTTDGDGTVRESVRATTATAVLILHAEEGDERYGLALGHLDPVGAVTGVQARLNNLGYGSGSVDGDPGPLTRRAINAFRRDRDLPLTDEVDAAFLAALEEVHRS